MVKLVKKWMIQSVVIVFVLLLVGCRIKELSNNPMPLEASTTIYSPTVISFVAVGDNLIHDAIYEAAYQDGKYDFNPSYQAIKPFISSHDLAFINQETMLGGVELGLSSYPSFNSPQEVGEALIDTGFNLFSIANNHTLDRGEQAIIHTVQFFKEHQTIYSGAEESASDSHLKVFTVNDMTFGFIAYTMLTNGQSHPQGKTYLANVYSREQATKDLKEVKDEVDVLLVSMHWGNEYENYPSDIQRNEAEYLSSLGVDVIIGHHPHVIQPIDWIHTDGHETLVIYSLGNFLSAQIGVDRNIGMAVSFDIVKTEDNRITIEDVVATLLYHHKMSNGVYRVIPYDAVTEQLLRFYDEYQVEKAMLIRKYQERIVVR